jgi:hypothetical protein
MGQEKRGQNLRNCARAGGVAGIQKYKRLSSRYHWIPASAGMTEYSLTKQAECVHMLANRRTLFNMIKNDTFGSPIKTLKKFRRTSFSMNKYKTFGSHIKTLKESEHQFLPRTILENKIK